MRARRSSSRRWKVRRSSSAPDGSPSTFARYCTPRPRSDDCRGACVSSLCCQTALGESRTVPGEACLSSKKSGILRLQSFDRTSQVGPGRRLVAAPEMIGAVDVWPCQEGLQNLTSLAPKQKPRHPRILLAHLSLVLIEPLGRRAENREVDVNQKRRVRRGWRGVVLRRQNKLMDVLGDRAGYPLLDGGILHGIVKPQRQFDFVDLVGQVPCLIEMGKTFIQVLDRVVTAMRFRVARPHDGVEIGFGRLHPESLPRRLPPFDIRHLALWGSLIAAESAWQRSGPAALALLDGDEPLWVRRARVVRTRADQAIVRVLLEDVRRPARDAADGEDRRVEIDRDAERVVGRR